MTDAEKIETVKAEMQSFKQQRTRVSLLKARLVELEDDINHPSIAVGGVNVRNGTISAGAARLVLIKAEVEEQLKIAFDDYKEQLAAVHRKLNKLPITERIVLEQRYVYEMPSKVTWTGLKMSRSTYYQTLDKAYLEYYNLH